MAPRFDHDRPLRIALACDWFLPRIGGIERHLAALAQHLVARGHDVTVVTPMPGAVLPDPRIRLQWVPARLLPRANVIWAPAAFRRVGRAIRNGSFDVVHVHTSIISPAAYAALYHAQRARIPAIATLHSVLDRWAKPLARLDSVSHWTRWPVIFSAVSERVARDVRPLVAPSTVAVLPNAVDVADWQLARHPPAEVIAIACVMRLVPRKRGGALLAAYHSAASQLPSDRRIVLRIAGDGPERRRLEVHARRLPPHARVEFLGSLAPTQIRELLATSHFFVLPSKLEAFGIAALEARAAGLPVIATTESGVAEFIEPECDGLLAADDAELAAHLLRLCRDDDLRKRITRHNESTPVNCTWNKVLPAHVAAYAAAVARRADQASLRR